MTLLYGIYKVADKAKTQTGLHAAYSLIAKGVFLGLLRFTSQSSDAIAIAYNRKTSSNHFENESKSNESKPTFFTPESRSTRISFSAQYQLIPCPSEKYC